MAVEINGSGMRRDGRPYPEAARLAGQVRRGVPISHGSDAHWREQLGLGWGEAVALLRWCAGRELVAFRERRSRAIALP